MDDRLTAIAAIYNYENRSRMQVSDLYRLYLKAREEKVLDAAAATAAVGVIAYSDTIDYSQITPQMEEAFRLAYPNMELSSLDSYSSTELNGIVSAWKGKYFEVLMRDELNAGEAIGDVQLGLGQTAVLADSPVQAGWDLRILNADGSVATELQLKATESLAYIKDALEHYPEIAILTTDEVLAQGSGLLQNVSSSGISNSVLEEAISAPLSSLLDSLWEDVFEAVVPGLPFALIIAREGRHYLVGRKSFAIAAQAALEDAAITGAAMGVGVAVFFLADGGFFSIPATWFTRVGLKRWRLYKNLAVGMNRQTVQIRGLLPAYVEV